MTVGKVKSIEQAQKGSEPSSPAHAFARQPGPAVTRPAFAAAVVPQMAGNLAVQRLFRAGAVQAKLAISQPGDADEQEADRIAEQVVSTKPVGTIQRKCAACSEGATCPKCEAEERVQPKEKPGHTPQINSKAAAQISALRGGGQPLPSSVRTFFEPRFGRDFSGVRVHTDSTAAESARAIQAKAYTVGQNIVFDTGQFAGASDPGQQLLAHELAHVVQQSSTGQWRIQRKKRPGKGLSIVKVVAFEKQLDPAEAVLSDGTIEPIELTKNTLAPGTYTYSINYDDAGEHDYSSSTGEIDFVWQANSVFEWPWDRAGDVTVRILEGDSSALDARIEALPDHIRKYLTSEMSSLQRHYKRPLGRWPYEDLESVANAGYVLQVNGVTEDELLQVEYERAEAANLARPRPVETDPVGWAAVFTEQRARDIEQAVAKRKELVELNARLEGLHEYDKAGIKNVADGAVSHGFDEEEVLRSILRRAGTAYWELKGAFEFELASFTGTFLSQAQVGLFRIERTMLQGGLAANERLEQAIEKIQPAVAQYDLAKEELEDRTNSVTIWGLMPTLAISDPKVLELAAKKKEAEAEVHRRAEAAGLSVASWSDFDWDLFRGGHNLGASRRALGQFVSHAHDKIREAQQKVMDRKTLYKADRMVQMTKATVGIKQGSPFDDLIRYIVKQETSDDSFWSTLWNVLSIALMFVPGNIGIALRLVAGAVDVMKEADEYSEQKLLSQTGQSSEAPSKLGLFLAVGGALFDAPEAARGMIKGFDSVATTAGSRAAKITDEAAAAGSRAAKTTDEAAAPMKVVDEPEKVLTEAPAPPTVPPRPEVTPPLRPGVATEVHTPGKKVDAEYSANGHEYKVLDDGTMIRCSENPDCRPLQRRLADMAVEHRIGGDRLKELNSELDKIAKLADPSEKARKMAEFDRRLTDEFERRRVVPSPEPKPPDAPAAAKTPTSKIGSDPYISAVDARKQLHALLEKMVEGNITPERLGYRRAEWAQLERDFLEHPERALQGLESRMNLQLTREEQVVEKGALVEPSARAEAVLEELTPRQTSVGTEAARKGTVKHDLLAIERRLSGEWDVVDKPLIGADGKKVSVPDKFDAAGNPAPGARLRTPEPDAVSFKREIVLDDKPLGRPPLADRNEILGNIKAFEIATGKPPKLVVIQYYDPDTGEVVKSVLFNPDFFR